MRKTRLLIACFTAACMAVPMASSALAQEPEPCADTWFWDYVLGLIPAQPDAGAYVQIADGTITIRGDLAAAQAASLVDHYTTSTERFVDCLNQGVTGTVSPYTDCVLERSEAIRTSPDPVGRYVEVGADLIVRIHYGLALNEARLIFNCNGIVTSG